MVKRKSKRTKRKTPTSKKEINKQRQIIGIVLIAVLIVAGLAVAFIGGRTTGAVTWYNPISWFKLPVIEPVIEKTCIDSDGGVDYTTAGYVTYTPAKSKIGEKIILEDFCTRRLDDINKNKNNDKDVIYLVERICDDKEPKDVITKCIGNCINGRCIIDERLYRDMDPAISVEDILGGCQCAGGPNSGNICHPGSGYCGGVAAGSCVCDGRIY